MGDVRKASPGVEGPGPGGVHFIPSVHDSAWHVVGAQ